MHFKSPRGHLTGGPAPPTPPDRFPNPHPVCPSSQMKTNGYIHPPTPPQALHCISLWCCTKQVLPTEVFIGPARLAVIPSKFQF